MDRKFLIWGFAFGLTAVILGAFGAHALNEILSDEQLMSFQTGIRYQFYHAFLLLIIGIASKLQSKVVINLLVVGVFLFSGSIYLLNLKAFLGLEFLKFLGPVTPVGGLMLISAWAILLIKSIKLK